MSEVGRRSYLDWLRGAAVLIMIEAHLFDSWTRFPDNRTTEFAYAMILGGFGAPLFLFLAGVVVPLSAGSKLRRSGERGAAWRAVARRGLEIFGLAFLFRVQAWVLGWSHPRDLLRVDILNIMGPSMIAAAALWAVARGVMGRVAIFALATLGVVVITPVIRAWSALGALPDPIEGYLRPAGVYSHFVLFPWTAFVFAGGAVGTLLDASTTNASERRVNLGFIAGGLALAAAAYQASFHGTVLPGWYPRSSFWTTSVSFFYLRASLIVAAIGAAWLWESRDGAADRFSPLRQLGRTSLFIYWIHVEMVYGFVSFYLRKSVSWEMTWVYYVAFITFMLVCSLAKDRLVSRSDGKWEMGNWKWPSTTFHPRAAPSSGRRLRPGARE